MDLFSFMKQKTVTKDASTNDNKKVEKKITNKKRMDTEASHLLSKKPKTYNHII